MDLGYIQLQLDPWSIRVNAEMLFAKLPMPPQSNHMYGGSRIGRRYPMPKLVTFKKEIETIRLKSKILLEHASILQSFQNRPLQINRVFNFQKSAVFTKDGRIKKMDVSNRIKACDDSLSVLFGIDDSTIFLGSEQKALTQDEIEHVLITISKIP